MNKISHIGMLASNIVNWSWQMLYLGFLTIKVIQGKTSTLVAIFHAVFELWRAVGSFSSPDILLPDAGGFCQGKLVNDKPFWVRIEGNM